MFAETAKNVAEFDGRDHKRPIHGTSHLLCKGKQEDFGYKLRIVNPHNCTHPCSSPSSTEAALFLAWPGFPRILRKSHPERSPPAGVTSGDT